MAKKLQILRGTTAQNDAYTGSIGELTMDIEKVEVRIHDGITQGGKTIGSGGGASLPILTNIWSDHLLNDVSWLRADTFSWHSGDVYVAAYEHLANELLAQTNAPIYAWEHEVTGNVYYTTTLTPRAGDKTLEGEEITSIGEGYIVVKGAGCFRDPSQDTTISLSKTETIGDITITYYLADDGHKICLPDQEANISALYESTGVAWYYILDTTNRQFKLPRTKFGFTGLRDSVGGYVAPGLPNITGEMGFAGSGSVGFYGTSNSTSAIYASGSKSGQLQNQSGGTTNNKININAARSNAIYGASDTVQPPVTQMYLYFYVGNFEQSAIEQTAGITAETLNGKADTDLGNIPTNYDYVVDSQLPTSANSYTWYRKYKSGWVEQGGRALVPATNGLTSSVVAVTLPIPIASPEQATLSYNGMGSTGYYSNCENQATVTTTTVSIGRWNNGSPTAEARYYNWTLSGMSAQ